MPALTTEGIILKRKDLGEADRIITVLTHRFGKISIIAKGVRRITSRRAGNIEVLNRAKLHIYQGKNYTLNEAESIETFQHIKANLTLSTAAFHVIELVDRLVPENQQNPLLYSLVVEILNLLDKHPRQIFIRAFEIKLLALLGFWSVNQIPHIQPAIQQLLEKLQYSNWREIDTMTIDESEAQNLELLLRQYMEQTLEANLKSASVMRKLKSN